MTPEHRRLLPGLLPNLRDVGGLSTVDGRVLAAGVLLRTSALVSLSEDARAGLRAALPPAVYVDLRTDADIRHDGEPTELVRDGWTWVRMPVQDREPGEGDGPEDALRRYRRALPRYLDLAAQVAELLGDRPVVVGCSLGKDRTGLLIAILLSWAGVGQDDVVADFAYSNRALARGRQLLPPRWHDRRLRITECSAAVCRTVLTEIPGPGDAHSAALDRLLASRAREKTTGGAVR
ncbi:tyrosine-protein phosphatase [Lentzea sp. NPDC004782]|uniref:tyrosine-protein phosphatase n=1 Tax=Lentzea sp. NPDC004782 TaxID=3154458 RepID=UPI0033BEC75F